MFSRIFLNSKRIRNRETTSTLKQSKILLKKKKTNVTLWLSIKLDSMPFSMPTLNSKKLKFPTLDGLLK
jgi:hypothetical protein